MAHLENGIFSSVKFSCSVVSDSLWPHEPQHARLPCPSQTPGVYPKPCPSSQWCHPTISSSVVPFSSCPQSLPASGSFQMSQLFASGGQKYWSFSFNISPSSEHSGLISFRMNWLDLLAVQGTLKSLCQHHSWKPSILQRSAFFTVQLSHIQSSLQVYNKTSKTVGLESNLYKGLCIIFFYDYPHFPPTGNHSKTNLFELNLALLFFKEQREDFRIISDCILEW